MRPLTIHLLVAACTFAAAASRVIRPQPRRFGRLRRLAGSGLQSTRRSLARLRPRLWRHRATAAPVEETLWEHASRASTEFMEGRLQWLENEVAAADAVINRAEDAVDGRFRSMQDELTRRLESDVGARLARDAALLPFPEYVAASLLRGAAGAALLCGGGRRAATLGLHAALSTLTSLVSLVLGSCARTDQLAPPAYPTSRKRRGARLLRRLGVFSMIQALTRASGRWVSRAPYYAVGWAVPLACRATFAAAVERTVTSTLPWLASAVLDDRQEWYSATAAAGADAPCEPVFRDVRRQRRFSTFAHYLLRAWRARLRAARRRYAAATTQLRLRRARLQLRRARRRAGVPRESDGDGLEPDDDEQLRLAAAARRLRRSAVRLGVLLVAFALAPQPLRPASKHGGDRCATAAPPAPARRLPAAPYDRVVRERVVVREVVGLHGLSRRALGAYELGAGGRATLRAARPYLLRTLLAAILRARRRRVAQLHKDAPPRKLVARLRRGAVAAVRRASKVAAFSLVKALPWIAAVAAGQASGFAARVLAQRKKRRGAAGRGPPRLPPVVAFRPRRLADRADGGSRGEQQRPR
ncbi:hypothetical protein M885DRAFT_610190 [Pelagophyceae sp. CCMP2097]|nr:hypothetical protein M885DRAFT_610190 [Pelagophyceae sp. CCMP2097]